MYNTPKILKDLHETRAEIDKAIAKLKGDEKELKRYYKKGFKATGRRIRSNLQVTIKDLKSLRADVLRMTKEREVFKDTEFEDDFK